MNVKTKLYIFTIIFLLFLGNLMIYSSSMIWAEYITNNQYYYLIRQLIFTAISLIIFIICLKFDYKILKKHANKILIVTILLLIAVLIPFIGMCKNGARSWIGINELSFQPSEIAKIAMIIFTSKYLDANEGSFKKEKNLFLYLILLLFIFGLIMLEPDFGSGFILTLTILIMMFKDLVKIRYLILGVILSGIGIVILILTASYRLDRITSYLNPWSDPLGTGFQSIQSLYAISPAGLFGHGLFKSHQKFYFLPEPQTDFIFAIIVEELGLIGGLIVIASFSILIVIGYYGAMKCEDIFSKNILFGFTTLIFVQAFINMGVVTGLLPVTGVTLPFLSYGGSSLITTMAMMGINLNILKSKAIMTHFN